MNISVYIFESVNLDGKRVGHFFTEKSALYLLTCSRGIS